MGETLQEQRRQNHRGVGVLLTIGLAIGGGVAYAEYGSDSPDSTTATTVAQAHLAHSPSPTRLPELVVSKPSATPSQLSTLETAPTPLATGSAVETLPSNRCDDQNVLLGGPADTKGCEQQPVSYPCPLIRVYAKPGEQPPAGLSPGALACWYEQRGGNGIICLDDNVVSPYGTEYKTGITSECRQSPTTGNAEPQ